MRILDLFCGAGGAAVGYRRAGLEVVGVDVRDQPNYPFDLWQQDALDVLREVPINRHDGRGVSALDLTQFDFVHASPPCQAYTQARHVRGREHPDLVEPLRDLLVETGLPYVIENVVGSPLRDPIMLCGAMFPGLRVYRHRLFESSVSLRAPDHPDHVAPLARMGDSPREGEFMHVVGHFPDVRAGRAAMSVGWMTRDELSEAVPPDYTEYLGRQLVESISGVGDSCGLSPASGDRSRTATGHQRETPGS